MNKNNKQIKILKLRWLKVKSSQSFEAVVSGDGGNHLLQAASVQVLVKHWPKVCLAPSVVFMPTLQPLLGALIDLVIKVF